MKALVRVCLSVCLLAAFAACPPPAKGADGTRGAPGGTTVNPEGCGKINTSKAGRKLYAFLVASAELDKASLELENTVRTACATMATDLGVSPEGKTADVCARAKAELDANLQISVKTEKRLVTKYTPPVCTTDVSFTAGFAAECEAKASADIAVQCQGSCGGTCNGACDGTCSAKNASGECAGNCSGTCKGSCSGSCQGYADVNASAECKASAEIRATTHTTCTPAKTEIVSQDVTVVDATKWNKAMAAINHGLPTLLTAGAKLQLVGKAMVLWVQTGASLVKASGQLAGELGSAGVCVAAQIAGVVAASVQIEARVSVSVEASASVSSSAGATAQ